MAVILYRLKQNGRAAVILPDGFLFGTDNAKINIKKKLLKECNLHTVIRMPSSVFAPYTSITTSILFFDRTHSTEETRFYRLDMPAEYKGNTAQFKAHSLLESYSVSLPKKSRQGDSLTSIYLCNLTKNLEIMSKSSIWVT